MARATCSSNAGFLFPNTMMAIIAATRPITTIPGMNHNGDMPANSTVMAKPTIMSVTNAPSIVICMSNAADEDLPGSMPRRRASSTTSVMPARFSEGATVFMKNVPKTRGSVARGVIFSPTAAKENT